MRYDFAPMEGLTDSIYRRIHHRFFPGVDRYIMPFLSPTVHRSLTHKEDRELPFADKEEFVAVPQILTKSAEDFLWAAQVCKDRGYREVNLNLGCPSGTVVSKGKGSGMLSDLAGLDAFLEEIFSRCVLPISVKTRLGLTQPEEFPAILEIFNRYPMVELTVHPRVRKQFYDGDVNLEMFRYTHENSRNPLCYNGDLKSKADIEKIARQFPQITAMMLGRGLVADPSMLSQEPADAVKLEAFMNELLENYMEAFGGSRNAMFRLKENWHFLITRFSGAEKLWKRLRKTTDLGEYKAVCGEIFHTLPLISPENVE